jgi:hypothetical protein
MNWQRLSCTSDSRRCRTKLSIFEDDFEHR